MQLFNFLLNFPSQKLDWGLLCLYQPSELLKSSASVGIDKQEGENPLFNLYIVFGKEISEIYMRKPRRRRTGRVRGLPS